MTVCNMSIEGGARCGYVNPDRTTVEYLRGRRYTPNDAGFDGEGEGWLAIASDPGTVYDDVVAHRRQRDRALDHLGHPSGPQPRRLRVDPRPRTASPTTSGRASRKPSSTWTSPPAPRSKGRRSTSPSSARAPTAASPTCARPRASRRRATSSRACARWSCRARMAVARAGRSGRAPRDLPRGGLRMARARLLDVPGDEPGQAEGPRGLRLVEQPQLQGPPGLAARAARS